MKLQKKPHGLDISFGYQILSEDKKTVLKEQMTKAGSLQAVIILESEKPRQKITLPMRSFVNNFINKLHGILTGDGGTDTKKSTVSAGASLTASIVDRIGVLIGQGAAPVNIGDANLDNQLDNSATFAYKGTTFIAPSVVTTGADGGNVLSFTIKRLMTNSNVVGLSVYEIGIKARDVSASSASAAGALLLARDTGVEDFTYESNGLFSYNFSISQEASGNGGPVLNLLKLIYNLMFKGNQNASGSRLTSRTNSALSTIAYATLATAGATNPFIIDGAVGEPYIGIVVGHYSSAMPIGDPGTDDPGGPDNPNVSGDDTTFQINHTDLTATANTVSAITNPYTGTSEFSITRDFTLASTSAIKRYNRVGLLTKGTANGITLGSDQVFLMINRPGTTIELQPGLTLRTVYKLQIRV